MKIKKFNINESNTTETKNVEIDNSSKDTVRVPKPEEKQEKKEEPKPTQKVEIKNESVKSFNEFHKINEDGTATATLGNTGGMGAVVAPQASSIPGDVAGSTPGSGDLPAYDMGDHFGTSPFKKGKKKKKKKSPTKENRHLGKTDSVENYVTKFSDWLKSDFTN